MRSFDYPSVDAANAAIFAAFDSTLESVTSGTWADVHTDGTVTLNVPDQYAGRFEGTPPTPEAVADRPLPTLQREAAVNAVFTPEQRQVIATLTGTPEEEIVAAINQT